MNFVRCNLMLLGVACTAGPSTTAGSSSSDTALTEDTHTDEHTHGTGTVGSHIHSIQWWRDTREVVLATHDGTWRTQAGTFELLELNDYGDFMSMVQHASDADRYWASGHWEAGGFGNWGFIESTDGASTWAEVSLSGEVDFHHMAVLPGAPEVVVGFWNGRIWVSLDSGTTWAGHAWASTITGVEIADASGPVLWIGSSRGIERLTLPAMTIELVSSANVTGLDRHAGGLIYATDSTIFVCDDNVGNCTEMDAPRRGATMHMLLEDADHCWVLTTESQVRHTEDGGQSWQMVVDGG